MTHVFQESNSNYKEIPQVLEKNRFAAPALRPDGVSHQPTIALVPCCELCEDFFDTISVSLEIFCKELTGGWLFNDIESLKLVGIRTSANSYFELF